jgi:hypothetical protein
VEKVTNNNTTNSSSSSSSSSRVSSKAGCFHCPSIVLA